MGLIYEEAGSWSEAILAPQTSTGLDICLPETYVLLTRALYPRHGREMNLGLPQSPIGCLQMILCITLDDEDHQAIHQRINDSLGILASNMSSLSVAIPCRYDTSPTPALR